MADEKDDTVELPDIVLKKQAMDIRFSPAGNVIAASTVTGRVQLYAHGTADAEPHRKLYEATHHRRSARCIEFSADGRTLFSGGADSRVRALDVETLKLAPDAASARLEDPPACMALYSPQVLCTGGDEGRVAVWDVRAPPAVGAVLQWHEHGDAVGDLWAEAGRNNLLAAGTDGCLSVMDLRGKGSLVAISEPVPGDDELLSMAVLKGGRKVVCGSQAGALNIFSYGKFDALDDSFPGHPESVSAMLKIDEETIATGSSDGLIRLVSIHPNKLIGVLGEHEEFDIETLRKNADNTLMASCSHDCRIKFWDIRCLYEEDEDEEEDEEGGDGGGGGGGGGAAGGASDSDDDDMGGGARSKLPASTKQGFFDGLQ